MILRNSCLIGYSSDTNQVYFSSIDPPIRDWISNNKSQNRAKDLKSQQNIAQIPLWSGSQNIKGQINQIMFLSKLMFQQSSPFIEFWKSMFGAWIEAEQLWKWNGKVDELGNEEEEKSFGEMAKRANHPESNPSKIGVAVSDEHLGRKPAKKRNSRQNSCRNTRKDPLLVVVEQSQTSGHKREH